MPSGIMRVPRNLGQRPQPITASHPNRSGPPAGGTALQDPRRVPQESYGCIPRSVLCSGEAIFAIPHGAPLALVARNGANSPGGRRIAPVDDAAVIGVAADRLPRSLGAHVLVPPACWNMTPAAKPSRNVAASRDSTLEAGTTRALPRTSCRACSARIFAAYFSDAGPPVGRG